MPMPCWISFGRKELHRFVAISFSAAICYMNLDIDSDHGSRRYNWEGGGGGGGRDAERKAGGGVWMPSP